MIFLRMTQKGITMHVQSLSSGEGIALIAPKSRNLPVRILRAFDNAKHIIGLKRGVKDTLAEICRFVKQADPLAPIFPHKNLIATRIGVDARTVYRHLNDLKAAEMIEVLEQERKSRNGRFAVSRIRLTRKAAELLGLIEPKIPVIHNDSSAEMSDGHTLTEPTGSSLNKQPAPKGKIIPDDLKWLTGNGLRLSGVFKLMKIASQNKKRLSDICLATYDYLHKLKGRHLFNCIAMFAKNSVCYALDAAHAIQRMKVQAEADRYKAKGHIFRERFAGVTMTNRRKDTLYQIDSKCRFAQVTTKAGTATMPINDLKEWIDGIESGKLVLATLATERELLGLI